MEILAPFSTADYTFARDGVFDTVNTDDFDLWFYVANNNVYTDGGILSCGTGFVFGTWVQMDVVDKDGLVPADYRDASWPVLKSWVKRSYPNKDGFCDVKTPYAGHLPQYFYIRIRVHRTGTETFPIAVNLNLHESV
jgi:hypothetical protein